MSIRADSIRITPEILLLIFELDEFKGTWRALGTIAPERLSALRRVATIEGIGSSTRIEGNRLTDREVERLLSTLEITPFTTCHEQDVAGYIAAMDLLFRSSEDVAITENHIRQLHRDVLTGAVRRRERCGRRRRVVASRSGQSTRRAHRAYAWRT